MSTQIPKTMRACVQDAGATAPEVRNIPVIELQANDVLIKVAYAALNPVDGKFFLPESTHTIVGSDLSGTIVALGPNINNKKLKVGARVATMVHGGKYTDIGAFAEYARAESELVWEVPAELALEDAAAFSMGVLTSGQLLFQSLAEELPPAKVSNSPWLLVYGGSSSTGIFTIQLAKIAGYRIVATASPRNFDLLKQLGAEEVVDYNDADKAVARINEITGGVSRAIDLISVESSFNITLRSFGQGPDNKLRTSLEQPESTKGIRSDVDVYMPLAFTMFGKPFTFAPGRHFPAQPENRAFAEKLIEIIPSLVTEHGLRGPPLDVRQGLDGIKQGIEELLGGEVSGKKIVYQIGA